MSSPTAHIFAPPPQRAILQPSLHPRGGRPYLFSGEVDSVHAPGALIKNGATRCAVDAAFLIERILGPAKRVPPMWPGVPGARERAYQLGQIPNTEGHTAYPYQQEGAAFLAERDYALLLDEMGCVDGDAVVHVSFNNSPPISLRLAELHRRAPLGARILANVGDKIGPHPFSAVLPKGKRPVLRLRLHSGKSLRLTPDHEVALADGTYRAAEKLRSGDMVLASMNKVLTRSMVRDVAPDGETDVYDIVCADPHRNFVANGVVVHNCGKTNQALLAAEARLSFASIPAPTTPVVLILCPALAKRHWQREVTKWTNHEAAVLETLTPTELPQNRYIIANYDILYGATRKDAAGVVHDVGHLPGWAMSLAGRFLIVIADEAHMLRGRQSRRTKAVKAMCRSIPVFWALTGTPVPNYIRDLWALFDVITDGLQGFSYWDWAKRYADAVQAQYGWKDTGSSNLEELQARMGFFCLGRTAASVNMQLPEKRREIFKIDVTVTAPTVHEGHQALTRSGFVGKALRRTAVAKRSAVVAQTLECLEAKQKIVVFVYMREQADEIVKAVRAKIDCPVYCVHGDLSPDGRDAQATVFRNVQAPAAFVATIDSVAVAISLVGANLVLFADLVPEPWKLLQAEKRCHRHGSTERVLVRYLIGTGTLDEGVADTVITKLAAIEQALGTADDQNELSTMLGGGKQKDEEIIGSLFERLKALGKGEES